MIEESRAVAVIIRADGAHDLQDAGVPLIEFDFTETARAASAMPPISAGDTACVLFTSGSTGKPKGVVLQHRNLIHFATNARLPRLTATDRVAHISSVSFDAFHFETWCAFAVGAEVVVLDTLSVLLNGDLHRELRQRRISVMLMPSMALNHIIRDDREAFSSLRILCTGGDVILPSTCRELLESTFSGELHNLYGPTEASTACVSYHIKAVPQDADSVPIGIPFEGIEIRLLDENLKPVTTGTIGQIHISGASVASGYLGSAGMTSPPFRSDPWAPGSLMYATGDLARLSPDGLLEFQGRVDDQVKIRGYRVEPAEVERVVGSHQNVRQAAVLAVGSGQDQHLVALVLPHGSLSIRELREYAVGVLPGFMIPTAFVKLDHIPVNGNGKRDIGELRRIVEAQVRRHSEHVPPSDEVERYVADLWEELLSVEEVGATEDFFALGGNSLLAFRALQRIKREMGIDLSSRDILERSELRQIAALIRKRKESLTA
jgi:amino acid adenylation domain-containing protein